MTLPRHQHRFEGDSGIDIASHTIDVLFPGGEKRSIVLRLGAPFQKEGGWWIRTELENLDSTDGPIAGEGSLHTLVLGVRWIVARLETFESKHSCRYFWANTSRSFDYRAVLSTYEKTA